MYVTNNSKFTTTNLLSIFSHNLDLRKNNKFCQYMKTIRARIYELLNCTKIKSVKVNRTKIRSAQNLMGLRYFQLFATNNYLVTSYLPL